MKKILPTIALAAMLLNITACGMLGETQSEPVAETRETDIVIDAEEISLHHSARTAPFAAALDKADAVVQKAADAYVPPLRTEDGALLLTYAELSARMDQPEAAAQVDSWFENALFIGDSRTVGLSLNAGADNADFFCWTGMTVFDAFKKTVKLDADAPDDTKVDLETVLTAKQYDKIYIMLGINELGSSLTRIEEKYAELLTRVQALQPGAKIWLQANMHVSQGRSDKDPTINNPRIDELNGMIRALAERQGAGWLDVNPLFDDAGGALSMEYTFDHTHINGKHYKCWGLWIALQSADQMQQMP